MVLFAVSHDNCDVLCKVCDVDLASITCGGDNDVTSKLPVAFYCEFYYF